MAWTAPKVDWDSVDGVADSDLNEIGENLVYLKAHVDATTGIHGAVSIATPSTLIIRDVAGRAAVAAPSAETDIALKSNVTDEATERVNADAAQDLTIAGLGTDKVDVAGDTMTGQLIGHGDDTDYTVAQFRSIKLLTSVPGAGDLNNGEIGFVYEV